MKDEAERVSTGGLDEADDLDKLLSERKRLVEEAISMREDIKSKSILIQNITNKIDVLRRGGTTFNPTDHALVRYLQRVKGVDIDAIRAELRALAIEACEGIDGSNKTVSVDGGLTFTFGERCTIASVWRSDDPAPLGAKPDTKEKIVVKRPPIQEKDDGRT